MAYRMSYRESSNWWCVVNEQSRDLAANDNRNAQQQVEDAQAMRRWAESRASSPAYARQVMEAARQAQDVMRAMRPRSV